MSPESNNERVNRLLDNIEKSQSNAKGMAILAAGARMMQTPGTFGQALGAGAEAGIGTYQKASAMNDLNKGKALDAALSMERNKASTRNAGMYANAQIIASQIASESRMQSAINSASAKLGMSTDKLMNDLTNFMITQYEELGEDFDPNISANQWLIGLNQLIDRTSGGGQGVKRGVISNVPK